MQCECREGQEGPLELTNPWKQTPKWPNPKHIPQHSVKSVTSTWSQGGDKEGRSEEDAWTPRPGLAPPSVKLSLKECAR